MRGKKSDSELPAFKHYRVVDRDMEMLQEVTPASARQWLGWLLLGGLLVAVAAGVLAYLTRFWN